MSISICLKDAQFSLEEIHILNNQNAASNRRHRSVSAPFAHFYKVRCGKKHLILYMNAHVVWHCTILQTQ